MTDEREPFSEVDEIAAHDAWMAWREAVRRGHPSAPMWKADYERLRGIDEDER